MTESLVRETFRLRAPLQDSVPYSASNNGERHTPGLPSPVTLRLQGFYPRDALFPPMPPAMFQTVTLLGFTLRRVPLPRHGRSLPAHPARLALARTDLPTRAMQVLARLPGFRLRGSPLSPAPEGAVGLEPPLGFVPLQGYPLSATPPPKRALPPSSLDETRASTHLAPAPRSLDRRKPRSSPKRASPPPGVLAPRPG